MPEQTDTGAVSPIDRAEQPGSRSIPELTVQEFAVLIALIDLGFQAYENGEPGDIAAFLDEMHQDAFDGLASKLEGRL